MNTKFKSLLVTSLLTFISCYTIAQSGVLKGTVSEAKNNEAAIGATIRIKDTQMAAMTDVAGSFLFSKIPAGNYTVVVTNIGFAPKEIPNVRVESDKTTILNIPLEEDSKMLEAVVVKAQRMTGTEISVITEIREVQNIAVGVSSQQITKTQDRDASQVVRRIPGVSIFDDRFIVIRGLNERYNTVLLNDIITPSTEVDVKSFSFDLIPSTAIDRMLVFKSPSADLPGDIAGGAIKIYTKTVPDGNTLSGNFSVGYRNTVTGQTATDYKGGGLDWLGFDDGTRKLPSSFPSTKSVINNAARESMIENFRNLNPYYSTYQKTVNPDFRGNLSFSRRFFFKDKEITNISYINYSNTNLNPQIKQNRYLFDGSVQNDFVDNSYSNNVRLGVMSNWAIILNSKNKIEFRNLFNQLASKETVSRLGNLYENNLEVFNQSFRFEQKSIFSSQLNGTHEIDSKTKLKWISGFGYTIRKEPDFRRFTSSRAIGSSDPFKMDLQQFESPTLQQAARFYSNMDEFVVTGAASYEKILGEKNEENSDLNKILKTGFYTEYKDRYFKARWFGIVNPNRVTSELLSLNPENFFSNDNLRSSRVYYSEGTNYDDKYTAQNLLTAAYGSMYLPVGEKFNATVGFRGEFNKQMLQSRERGGGKLVNVDNPVFSPLPSLNATYKLNTKNLLRFGFGSTVNRPEFRELAPFTYYDFVFDVSRRGNKDIKIAKIQNFDLRYDFYPSETELITFGVFYKKFKDPIEAAVFYNGSTVAFTVANSESAYSTGIELEARKNIGKEFMVLFNASIIKSDVKVGGITEYSRYLQGQSPYLINSGIFYNKASKGIQANILYNVIGPRIFVIGDNVLSSNVFEMPRHVIDLNLSKSFGRTEIKAGIQDLLNQSFKLIQDTDRNNKITDSDGIFQQYKRGTNSYIGISYKL